MSKQILLIEDEPIVALQLKEMLSAHGFIPIGPAKSYQDAKALLGSHDISLILSDQNLGGQLGSDLVRKLLQEKKLPVVFLTAYNDKQTLEQIKAVSPYGYINKPVKGATLITTLEVALKQFSEHQNLNIQFNNLQSILDALQIGAILIDTEGTVTYLNNLAKQYLEAAIGTGEHWCTLFDLEKPHLDELSAFIEGTLPGRVLPLCLKNRTYFDVHVSNSDDGSHKIITLVNKTELKHLRNSVLAKNTRHGMIGKSQVMEQLFERIHHFALSDIRVLIYGETGTGKELVARALHTQSQRKKQPFVVVNCAAFSKELVASALFGHKKGAFTGALNDHKGFFELADGGTLFLDEIGDIDQTTQIQLLRVLETGELNRVGDNRVIKVDVRVITATHRDLEKDVETGRFRQDLYYRIHVARLSVPALRDRKSDIRLMANHFLKYPGNLYVTEISESAMQALLDYDWPGNVRELRNVIEASSILPAGNCLEIDHLPKRLYTPPEQVSEIEAIEKETILQALKETGFKKAEAARLLGIGRTTLYRKLEEYGLK